MVKKTNAIQTNDTNNLVKRDDCNANIDEIKKKITKHGKYITTQELNKLMAENFAAI